MAAANVAALSARSSQYTAALDGFDAAQRNAAVVEQAPATAQPTPAAQAAPAATGGPATDNTNKSEQAAACSGEECMCCNVAMPRLSHMHRRHPNSSPPCLPAAAPAEGKQAPTDAKEAAAAGVKEAAPAAPTDMKVTTKAVAAAAPAPAATSGEWLPRLRCSMNCSVRCLALPECCPLAACASPAGLSTLHLPCPVT